MVYRLYVETVKCTDKIAWAYTFYNHQDFLVYKRAGTSDLENEETVLLEQTACALEYFERSMRRRYYDEHFSTRIDEDYVTLYTSLPEIIENADKVKQNDTYDPDLNTNKEIWLRLVPFFKQKTMSFEKATNEKFINSAKELAKSKI